MTEWTFLTNHALVLNLIAKNQRRPAGELASAIGITERTVRKIIAELTQGGYISKEKEGRRVRYHINPDLTIRDKLFREIVIGDLLKILGWKTRQENITVTKGGVINAALSLEQKAAARDMHA